MTLPGQLQLAFDEPPRRPPPAARPPGLDELQAALAAIAAGGNVTGEMARRLVGAGLAHVTPTRLLVTEQGEALLATIPQVRR